MDKIRIIDIEIARNQVSIMVALSQLLKDDKSKLGDCMVKELLSRAKQTEQTIKTLATEQHKEFHNG